MKKTTIRDICDETGLALGTVSKYLNGGKLKKANKEKVEAAIKKLNYRVDEYARGLITNRTRTIGVLISRFDNLFYSRIVSDIEARLYEKGYATIIRESSYDLNKELESIEWFISRRVDALVIIPVGRKKEDYRILDNVGVPVIFLDSFIEGVNSESIVTNNEEISRQAINYIIGKGHRKIAIIMDKDNPYTAEKRLSGYKRAFRENGIDESQFRIYKINESIDSGYQTAKSIVTETDTTAIFASNYISTVGVVYLLNELNIKVPQEMSVLGFDDIMITDLYRPKLTIINQPMREIAKLTVEKLFSFLSGDAPDYAVNVLKSEIYIGETIADIR